ncbi:MAG: ATP-binding protein [Fimbriimonadaceae bacterium]|nr:ATP-binding protein [Fimbriimonadaceae bacterium]
MTQGDLLRRLFRSHALRDDEQFRLAAEAIVSEERAKNHRLLADDLERLLVGNGSRLGQLPWCGVDLPKDGERGLPLVDLSEHDDGWDRLVVQSQVRDRLTGVVQEHRRADVLRASGLRPRQRLLFYGPPGCGKTVAARVVSGLLAYPLVTVRFDAIVSSFLGETAANLRKVFDFISRGQWVVLFDEFDAIGKDRDNPLEHGELKRLVNTLLQLMDSFQGESLLIAATNHEGLLDQAVWRRFDEVVEFSPPKQQDRALMLRLFLRGFDSSAVDTLSVARKTDRATGADLERIALAAARGAVLDGRHAVLPIDLQPALDEFRIRRRLIGQLMSDASADTASTEV